MRVSETGGQAVAERGGEQIKLTVREAGVGFRLPPHLQDTDTAFCCGVPGGLDVGVVSEVQGSEMAGGQIQV